MSDLFAQLIGGGIGLLLGCLSVWLYQMHEARQHARECLRRFDAHVARLEKRRRDLDVWLEQSHSGHVAVTTVDNLGPDIADVPSDLGT